MPETHYAVVEQGGHWIIIGECLRFGHYADRLTAERAARGLAESSAVEVQLHLQDDNGVLLPPERLS